MSSTMQAKIVIGSELRDKMVPGASGQFNKLMMRTFTNLVLLPDYILLCGFGARDFSREELSLASQQICQHLGEKGFFRFLSLTREIEATLNYQDEDHIRANIALRDHNNRDLATATCLVDEMLECSSYEATIYR